MNTTAKAMTTNIKTKKFDCLITGYSIEFTVDTTKNEAQMECVSCDYKNMKALFLLLRGAIDELVGLKVKTVKQLVTKDDYNSFLKNKTTWRIDSSDNILNSCLISCHIDEFSANFAKGLGAV